MSLRRLWSRRSARADHGQRAYQPAPTATSRGRQRRRVLARSRAVRPQLPEPRRPLSGADAATGPWLCLTDPEDIKRVFTADTGVLRLGAALAKASSHHLFLGPTGLTNLDGAEHMRMRRLQLPPFQGRALPAYEETMEHKTEEALARWPYGRSTPPSRSWRRSRSR